MVPTASAVDSVASSSKSTSDSELLCTVEEAVTELGHTTNKAQVQIAMDALAALKERETAKESEDLMLTRTPVTAEGFEAVRNAQFDDPMSDMFDFLQGSAIRSKTEVIGSKAPLNLKKVKIARKRYYRKKLPKVLEEENAMLKEMAKLLPPELRPNTKPLVKQEYPVDQEFPVEQEFLVKQGYKQEPMTIAVPISAVYLPTGELIYIGHMRRSCDPT